jgi:hypothetical protein
MKKIYILILVIFSLAKSQDKEPLQHQFTVIGVDTYLNASDPNFQQKHFLKGWHWDSKKKINTALRMNQVDIYDWNNEDQFQDSAMLVIKPWNWSHGNDGKLFNARSIQYAPYLLINSTNPDELVIRNGDTIKEVFGFKYINGNIDNNPNSPNFYKLIIDSSKKNSIILDNPWPQDFFSKSSDISDTATKNNYLCRQMYISINLSKIGNSIGNDFDLLRIELPYSIIDTTQLGVDTVKYDFIQFDKIPSSNLYDTIQNNRGIYRNLIDTVGLRYFHINRNMLPSNNSNITISAHFQLIRDDEHNLEIKDFSPPKGPSKFKIDSLGIRVTYLGRDSIAINWVRFETPHAQKFLRGYYDNIIIEDIQNVLNRYNSNQFTQANPGSKLFRFNTIIEGFLMNWQAERYLNKLIGNIGTSEVGNYYTKHYERYVNPPDRWFGLVGLGRDNSQPYT